MINKIITMAIFLATITISNIAVSEDNVMDVGLSIECDQTIREKSSEAIESIIKIIIDEKGDSAVRDMSLMFYNGCKKELLVDNLSNKILYLVFGEVVIDALTPILSVMGFTIDDSEEYYSNLRKLHISVDSSFLANSIAKVISAFAMVFLGLMYGKMLLKYRGGDIDKSFLKNNLKIFTGVALLIPSDYFSGYSAIQFIGIMGIIIGIVVATSVWLVSIFMINFYSLYEDIEEKTRAEINGFSFYADSARYGINLFNNINAHICEIKNIETAIDLTMGNIPKTKINIEKNEIYKCITSDIDIKEEIRSNKRTPHDFLRAKKCLLQNDKMKNYVKRDEPFCGKFINDSRITNDLVSSVYQNEIRDLAIRTRVVYCEEKNEMRVFSDMKPFNCIFTNPKLNSGADFNYDINYDDDDIAITIHSSDESKKTEAVDRLMKLYKEKYNYKKFQKQVEVLILKNLDINNDKNADIVKFSNMLSYVIKMGWLGTPSMYFSTPELDIQVAEINADLIFSIAFESENFSDIRGITLDGILTDLDFTFNLLTSKTVNHLNDVILDWQEKDQRILSNKKVQQVNDVVEDKGSNYFSDFSLFKMVGNDFSISNCLESDSSNDNCIYTNINPFKKIVENGRDVLDLAETTYITSLIFDTLWRKAFFRESKEEDISKSSVLNITSLLMTVSGVFIMIGLFFGLALPLIPFLVFSSIVVSWLVHAFKVIIAIEFLALYYLIPTENEEYEGQEINIYKSMITVILNPFFIILGATVSFLLIHFSIGLVNVSFGVIADLLNLIDDRFNSDYSLLKLLDNFYAFIVYVIILTILIIKATRAMILLPQALNEWFELDLGLDDNMFQTVEQIATRIVMIKI